ncbi:MAG: anaerobic sulfatase maturase [Candidatus Delongbacteria bacterium]|nr:anaerobic sulfatase maturase [Candidatus Delongbacteria bacterium]
MIKQPDPIRSSGFHLMAKPVGPRCNLRCSYCFYGEKSVFFAQDYPPQMPDPVLETYIREYILSQSEPQVTFDWQGGEPTLAGLDFFRRVIRMQRNYSAGKRIHNTIQTNGLLIDDAWCEFLARNQFLVGLSLDGPEFVHDTYRVGIDHAPTCAAVVRAFSLLRQFKVEVNILATVNRASSCFPLEVYRFFRELGVQFIQFIPIVERHTDPSSDKTGLQLAGPPVLTRREPSLEVTPWSVEPEAYGEFMGAIFQEWVSRDVGRIYVMNFEWILAALSGIEGGVCHLAPRCGRNLILEHNGDVFACDHYMYPAYRLGNILHDNLRKMVDSRKQTTFGLSKETALPKRCRRCEFLTVCHGGCPKHRFITSSDGEPGLNYLCSGLRSFYGRVLPTMTQMAKMIQQGLPVDGIMTDPIRNSH